VAFINLDMDLLSWKHLMYQRETSLYQQQHWANCHQNMFLSLLHCILITSSILSPVSIFSRVVMIIIKYMRLYILLKEAYNNEVHVCCICNLQIALILRDVQYYGRMYCAVVFQLRCSDKIWNFQLLRSRCGGQLVTCTCMINRMIVDN
jgi:hypothetical protein